MIKRSILKITTILAISAFATIGIKSANDSENPTINLIFANGEALAQEETTLSKECYDRYDSYGRKSTRVRICETCEFATVFNPRKNTICPK